ncbi:Xaa-Pro dipeptidyl-peptidase [Pilimelia terevasa]|uniref:Xaa-Pro dipeptidyl-peptidase n=1 Tax=Pilimelia terevasa TaxID=53372 RepID=A0A8J3BJS2_9ACTN|nr:Xaa-Pro dipeptidyl-peptidase [Pilimelia terevasa]GGK19807.1 Xaa-Pro dipeptidyl-peptidase [Pilimelia terevasa]
MSPIRPLFAACCAAALLAPALPAPAAPPGAGRAAAPAAAGTEPVYDYAEAIREQLTVEVPADSDADGTPDRVAVRVIRPRTAPGVRVPVIFQPSPYYSGTLDVPMHDDIDRADDALAPPTARRDPALTFADYLDNYFVPRGYAVVFADSLGSGGSTGCPTSGGRNETQGMRAVVDWLNGRARGADAAGAPVTAAWSTGRTGMIGTSYNGTLPNAVAATGVPGLATIVPVAAISNWYDYYRSGGGVVHPGGFLGEDADILARAVLTRQNPEVCAPVLAALDKAQDRRTGNVNTFWHERNYARFAGNVRASVLLVHGLHDWNVRMGHVGPWWSALATHGVPRKIWLHQGAHSSPFDVRRAQWLRTLHRWFDQWLYGVDTGIMREPTASVETRPGTWTEAADWPEPGTATERIPLDGGPAALRLTPGQAGRSFTDDPARTADDLVARETGADPGRLQYVSDPLPAPVRYSGTGSVTVRVRAAGASPYLTALLVDYGRANRFQRTERLTDELDCIGPGTPEDPGCFAKARYVLADTPHEIVSRGWLDLRNRHGLWADRPLRPGRFHEVTVPLQTQDHVFPAGHRLGLVLISTDRAHTLRYRAGTTVEVDERRSALHLPMRFAGP